MVGDDPVVITQVLAVISRPSSSMVFIGKSGLTEEHLDPQAAKALPRVVLKPG
jgi:hypothetical protein